MSEVIGIDLYNQCTTGGVAMTLASARADNEHVPCIVSITMNTYQVVSDDGVIPSLLASDSHRGGVA